MWSCSDVNVAFAVTSRIFRYAPVELALDYCRLGWAPSPALEGTYHGEFAVLMEWLCGCPAREPGRSVNDAKITAA